MNEPPMEHRDEPAPLEYRGRTTDQDATRPRFSAARIVAWTIGGILCFGVGIAFLLPNLGRPRDPSNRVKCASNLRQIGLACLLYANEDPRGRFPARFEDILLKEDITSEVFCCPSSNDERAIGPTTQATADQLSAGGHLSYVYVGRGLTNALANDSTFVLAYEPLKNHSGQGMNVLFADGHVEWLTAAQGTTFLTVAQSAGGKLIHWNGTAATVAATQP
jgi:prepilin-type processing-associated H-X9-DG protein